MTEPAAIRRRYHALPDGHPLRVAFERGLRAHGAMERWYDGRTREGRAFQHGRQVRAAERPPGS